MVAASLLKGILVRGSLSCSLLVSPEPRTRPGAPPSQAGSIYHHLECFLSPKEISKILDKLVNSSRLHYGPFEFWCLFVSVCFSDSGQVSNEFKASLGITIELPTVVTAVFHQIVLIGFYSKIRLLGDLIGI